MLNIIQVWMMFLVKRETLAKRTIEKLKQEESKKGNEEEETIPEDANMIEEINKEEEPMGLMQRRG